MAAESLTQSLQTDACSLFSVTDRFSTMSTISWVISLKTATLFGQQHHLACIFGPLSRYSLAPCQGHTPAMPVGSTLTHRCLGPCPLWTSAVSLPEVSTASGWLGAALSYLTLTSLAAVTHTLLVCTHPVSTNSILSHQMRLQCLPTLGATAPRLGLCCPTPPGLR